MAVRVPVDSHRRCDLDEILATGALVPSYQPLVDLESGAIAGYEALARWPAIGRVEPITAFAEAQAQGRLAELDWACRLAALRGALDVSLGNEQTLFVNAAAPSFVSPQPPAARDLVDEAIRELRVVLELTENSLASHPSGLLRTIRWARDQGWGIALDDVGVNPDSLALLPFVAPDVIKLDLSLVQQTPLPHQARTIAAVMAHAERTGAVILAEGIETRGHLEQALAFGARYGQGWFFGHPGPLAKAASTARLPFTQRPARPPTTPFELVRDGGDLRVGRKKLLLAMSHQIERQAMSLGDPPVVLSTFQTAGNFTSATSRQYACLAVACPFVGVLAAGLTPAACPGVCDVSLAASDPLVGEWAVTAVGPHYASALIARDLADEGPDIDRRFEFVITHDREKVVSAGRSLMGRITDATHP
ncbi:EAL domain-containing protein [Frankia sp. AiPs1]|uniref:sensor domain-containing phosphodiesterase n=1 Tax=Frankia sp. AiPs1 TaxID=573493 RepID=UPI002043906E|nr:EAL domain-containing protein [Frankia sp. AiPs1]MCM3920687.1 EAL domain-containing protein [Frankia sp. AiPs1]